MCNSKKLIEMLCVCCVLAFGIFPYKSSSKWISTQFANSCLHTATVVSHLFFLPGSVVTNATDHDDDTENVNCTRLNQNLRYIAYANNQNKKLLEFISLRPDESLLERESEIRMCVVCIYRVLSCLCLVTVNWNVMMRINTSVCETLTKSGTHIHLHAKNEKVHILY